MKKILLILLPVILLTGCSDKEIIEKTKNVLQNKHQYNLVSEEDLTTAFVDPRDIDSSIEIVNDLETMESNNIEDDIDTKEFKQCLKNINAPKDLINDTEGKIRAGGFSKSDPENNYFLMVIPMTYQGNGIPMTYQGKGVEENEIESFKQTELYKKCNDAYLINITKNILSEMNINFTYGKMGSYQNNECMAIPNIEYSYDCHRVYVLIWVDGKPLVVEHYIYENSLKNIGGGFALFTIHEIVYLDTDYLESNNFLRENMIMKFQYKLKKQNELIESR